eukprot:TRINITY_DN10264_c0_g1_i1.p1 TRINITY_DN10264_c0_g1~~TRINITY_DN10264_c0_g1_i1.p1  ORF type:complete len:198 (-),score=24.49 TRINITY_DN10264_c0_g1_i1:406-999(-)
MGGSEDSGEFEEPALDAIWDIVYRHEEPSLSIYIDGELIYKLDSSKFSGVTNLYMYASVVYSPSTWTIIHADNSSYGDGVCWPDDEEIAPDDEEIVPPSECLTAETFVVDHDDCDVLDEGKSFVNGGVNGHCFAEFDVSPLYLPTLTQDVRITLQAGNTTYQNYLWAIPDYGWVNTNRNFEFGVDVGGWTDDGGLWD